MPTPRDEFIRTLERKPPRGRVPHFELEFFLTMEAFGKVHPSQRRYDQWDQMEETERRLHREDVAETHVLVAESYEHSAIFVHPPWSRLEEEALLLEEVQRRSGDRYFTMMHADPTFEIPNGDEMVAFAYRLADDPQGVHDEARRRLDTAVERARFLREHTNLDGFALCSDYCFNSGPFLSPAQLEEFVFPYLRQAIAAYREMGYYVIKHTDGNVMPILDQLVESNPHALHSLDPQGGVDLAEMKRRIGDRVCLIGNVNCSLIDTGTHEQFEADVRRALSQGMPGGGYVFSTSNCVYTGMSLARYERMVEIWKEEGVYQ
jgi:uroporphyrinogen decarboxylase